MEPKLDMDVQSKKKLVTHLKTQLYNNRHLVMESIKNSGKPMGGTNTNTNNITRNIIGDLTIDELDRLLKLEEKKINLKRDIAKYLVERIKKINKYDYDSLIKLINETTDLNVLSVIIRLLNKAYYFGGEVNDEMVEKQIKKEAAIDKVFFNN